MWPKANEWPSQEIKVVTMNEYSAYCITAFLSWFQLGVKHTTQEESLQKPMQWQYIENEKKGQISASWEFFLMVRKNVEHPLELLLCAEFLVSNNPWPSISVTITCYFSQKPMGFSQIKEHGHHIGWRDFCHKTVIVILVVRWPNHEKLFKLHVDPPEVPQH